MCVELGSYVGGGGVNRLWRRRGRKDGTGLSSGKHITFNHNRSHQEATGSHIILWSH